MELTLAAASLGGGVPFEGTVTLDNAAVVVRRWVGDGVTAVCAQSDEIACLVLYGIREAGLACPADLAVIGVDANPMGEISSPPLTTVEFNPVSFLNAPSRLSSTVSCARGGSQGSLSW